MNKTQKLKLILGVTKMRKIFLTIACVLAFTGAVYGNYGLNYHTVRIIDERGKAVTGITSVTVRTPGTTNAATIYQDSAKVNAITQPMTTSSTNTTLSNGTFYWWGPDGWDFTVTDGTNIHTNYGHSAWNASDTYIVFPTYLSATSSTTYSDAQTATFGTDSDWVLSGGATADTFTAIPATTSTSTFNIGSASYTSDFRLFGDSGYHVIWDASEYTLELLDNVVLAVGTGDDYTVSHNGSATTVAGAYTTSGVVTHSTDVLFDGTYDAAWDDNRNQFTFEDNAILGLGGAHDAEADVKMYHDGSDLYLDAIIADEGWKIGDTTTGFDITYYFEGAGTIATDYDGDKMTFADDMSLVFGTGSDASIVYDETTDDTWELHSSKDIDIDSSLEDITISANAAGKNVNIDSVLGSIDIEAEENAANAVLITADGGTTTTMKLHNDTGTSVTEGAAAVEILADDGGVELRSTADLANAVSLTSDGGTTGTIQIFNDQGTSTTEKAASIQLTSDVGSIELWSGLDAADAVNIMVDGSTSSGITIFNDTGTGDESILAKSDVGGITVHAAAGSVDIEAVGASDGDIGINAGDDMTLTAAGDLTLAITGTWSAGGAALTNALWTTEVVAGTTDTLTEAESGKTVIYTMTGGACTVTLPDATKAGVWFKLIDGNPAAAADLTVDPPAGNSINGDTAGQYIKCENDRDGEGIYIFSTAADTWYTMACGSSTVWTEE